MFELPDVVLDLDAEGSPNVRPYDEASDGPSQDLKWGYDPAIPEAKRQAFEYGCKMRGEIGRLNKISMTPFNLECITDYDVMAVALFGKSKVKNLVWPASAQDAPTVRKHELRGLGYALHRNGIPRLIIGLDANRVISFMLQRQQLLIAAIQDPSLRAAGQPDYAQAFKKTLSICKHIHHFRKFYSRIDSPSSGVEVGADSIDDVHDGLLKFVRSQDDHCSQEDILKFVNNVTIKRISNNKELNRSMTLFGLQLASSIGLLPCILQYLQICVSLGFVDESSEAISLTRIHTGRSMLAAMEGGDGTAIGTRQQIFTLVTGMSSQFSVRQPSLFGLAAKDRAHRPEVFKTRVALLGELGAVRLLWHQWKKNQHYGVFIEAFRRCAQVLASVKGGGVGVDITTTTGHPDQDAALDLQTINTLGAFHSERGSRIPSKSVSGSNGLILKHPRITDEEIRAAFEMPNVLQAMRRFKELIDRIAAPAGEEIVGHEEAAERDVDTEQSKLTLQDEASTDGGTPEGKGVESTGEGPRSDQQ